MTKERAEQLLDAEIKRHLALASEAKELKLYASHMEVVQALMMASYSLAAVIPTAREVNTDGD